MTLEGFTFDFMKVTPGMDAQLYNTLNKGDSIVDGFGDELSVKASGLTVTVGTGAASVKGRFIRNTTPLAVNTPANSTGFVVLTIDLTKNNTFTGSPGDDNYKPVNNQIRIECVASLTQQDLFNGGSIFHWPLAAYTSNGSTTAITNNYNIDKMPKGVNDVLFVGNARVNVGAALARPIERYRIIQITLSILGSLNTANFHNPTGANVLVGGINNLNLVNDLASKTWRLCECDISLNNKTATMTRAKEINNAGNTAVPADLYIVSIVGIN